MFDLVEEKTLANKTEKRIKPFLDDLPKTAFEAYSSILGRSSDVERERIFLQIVVAAERSLSLRELNIASESNELSEKEVCGFYKDLELEPATSFHSTLKHVCGLFLTVHDSKVYLIHQTARKFLLDAQQYSQDACKDFLFCYEEAHSTIAEACINYLILIDFGDGDGISSDAMDSGAGDSSGKESHVTESDIEKNDAEESNKGQVDCDQGEVQKNGVEEQAAREALYKYSADSWIRHLRVSTREAQERLSAKSIKLCSSESGCSLDWFYRHANEQLMIYEDPGAIMPMYLASVFRLTTITKTIVQNSDMPLPKIAMVSALAGASGEGLREIVTILLEAGADVNAQHGSFHNNALQAAVIHGNEQVVLSLLAAGADVNIQGGYYGIALQAAARYGKEHFVQILLAAGTIVNMQGGEYGNALQAAVRGGNKQVVQILLAAGADANAQGGEYGNALQAASFLRYEKIVDVLLAAGALNVQESSTAVSSALILP